MYCTLQRVLGELLHPSPPLLIYPSPLLQTVANGWRCLRIWWGSVIFFAAAADDADADADADAADAADADAADAADAAAADEADAAYDDDEADDAHDADEDDL